MSSGAVAKVKLVEDEDVVRARNEKSLLETNIDKASEKNEQNDTSKNEGKKNKKDAPSNKKVEDKPVCSDLIVLGLPWKLSDQELKEYFEKFGPVNSCQVCDFLSLKYDYKWSWSL